MSKNNAWILAAAVVLAVPTCALVMVPEWTGGEPARAQTEIRSLDEWAELSRRPGFALLDKVDLDEYFVAVYWTEAHEIAFCYRWKAGTGAPDTSLGVRDPAGRPLQDASRRDGTTLNPLGSVPEHAYVHGMVIPIGQDYGGTVHVVFRDNHGSRNAIPAREVYTKSFDLGR